MKLSTKTFKAIQDKNYFRIQLLYRFLNGQKLNCLLCFYFQSSAHLLNNLMSNTHVG